MKFPISQSLPAPCGKFRTHSSCRDFVTKYSNSFEKRKSVINLKQIKRERNMNCFDESSYEKLEEKNAALRIENTAGDWHAYLDACRKIDSGAPMPIHEVLTAKRRSALAYLGKRAQTQGGVYSKSKPRILTAEWVQALGADNASLRFKRYPWLAALLNLLAEIEKMQEEVSMKSKVLHFSRQS